MIVLDMLSKVARLSKPLILVFLVGILAAADLPAFPMPAAAAELTLPAPFADSLLPPIGHSRFCLRYPDDCEVRGIDFRRRNIVLTLARQIELNSVNRQVNREIVPKLTAGNGATEEWLISPPAGDCKDYAITKRHELLARGWPSRALLLSEVVIPSGEHHVVLIVRVKDVDLVLDNLETDIWSVAMTHGQYQWVRIETPQNPKFWTRVHLPGAMQTAMTSQ
jgi:predicted transglutaminase-like cysteine proteinase